MFILRQTSVKMAVLLHKQAKVPFILIIAVYIHTFMQRRYKRPTYSFSFDSYCSGTQCVIGVFTELKGPDKIAILELLG